LSTETDARKRALSLLRTLGSTAVRAGSEKIKRKLTGTPAEDFLHSGAALRLARGLDELKGAAMKMGQMLSLADETVLPKPWREALARLQSDATARPWHEVKPLIESALEGPWPFSSIDETAVHAASIGQVHKARLQDGTPVAVKVRYPGLERSVRSDLENIKRVLLVANVLPAKADYDELFARVESLFLQELDFAKERDFYLFYRDKLGHFENIVVPEVFPELSNEKLLVTRWVDGVNLKDWMTRTGAPHVSHIDEALRDRLGHAMLELLFFEIFDNGFIQSDPNPANFLVTPEGKLCVLDFGATEELSLTLRENYKNLCLACMFGSKRDIIAIAEKMQLLLTDDSNDARDAFVQMMAITCEPFVHNYFSWKECHLTRRLKDKILGFAKATLLRPPPAELMFLNRRILGTQMLLENLGPTVRAREVILKRVQGS
jgi:aarF domain-containing kinase